MLSEGRWNELIFISFTNVYDTSGTVTMKVNGIDIYNLSSALLEILQTGKSDYRKFTDSSKSKDSDASNKKFISLGIDEANKIIVDIMDTMELAYASLRKMKVLHTLKELSIN
jgi:hypothetical protein